MMRTVQMIVTPAMAREWLGRNADNRALKQGHVLQLAGRIKRGEWQLSHQGIAFACGGRLLDGQHRLHAITLAGIAVPMLVSLDADPAMFEVVDNGGVQRTNGDILRMPNATVAVGSLALRLHQQGTASRVSPQMARPYVERFAPLVDRLTGHQSGSKGLVNAHIRLAAILAATNGEGWDYVLPVYRDTINRNYATTPAVCIGLIKRIDAKELAPRGNDFSLVVYARRAFTRAAASNAKMSVKDMPGRIERLRDEVAYVMGSA